MVGYYSYQFSAFFNISFERRTLGGTVQPVKRIHERHHGSGGGGGGGGSDPDFCFVSVVEMEGFTEDPAVSSTSVRYVSFGVS